MKNIEQIKANIVYENYLSECERKLNESGIHKVNKKISLKLFPFVYEVIKAGKNQNIQFKDDKLICERSIDHLYYFTFLGYYSCYKEPHGVFPFIISRVDDVKFLTYISSPDLEKLFDSSKIKLTYIRESNIKIEDTNLLNINFKQEDEFQKSYGLNTDVGEISYSELIEELR